MSFASYQVGAPDGVPTDTSNLVPAGERPVSVRSGSGVASFQNGQIQTVDTYASVNMADVDPSGGLHARTPTGSPRQGALQMTDIVKVPGGETTVQNAAALGLIEQDQNGRWILVPDGAAKLTQEANEAPVDDGEALADASAEGDLASLCETVSAGTQVSVLGQIAEAGEILPQTINRAASEAGISPAEMNERVSKVIDSFTHQAETTIKAIGSDDPSDFFNWCHQERSKELKAAIRTHGMERSTAGYKTLYQDYVASIADHDAAAVLEADFGTSGITAQQVGNKILLDIPGAGQVEYRTAVRQGFITVRGA